MGSRSEKIMCKCLTNLLTCFKKREDSTESTSDMPAELDYCPFGVLNTGFSCSSVSSYSLWSPNLGAVTIRQRSCFVSRETPTVCRRVEHTDRKHIPKKHETHFGRERNEAQIGKSRRFLHQKR